MLGMIPFDDTCRGLTVHELAAIHGVTHGLAVGNCIDETESHVVVCLNSRRYVVKSLRIPI